MLAMPFSMDSASRLVRLAAVAALLGAVAQGWASRASAGDDRLMLQIIENVRANEILYKDVEIVLEKRYTLGNPKHPLEIMLKEDKLKSRFVLQQGLVYFGGERTASNLKGEHHNGTSFHGWDGENMRMVDNGKIANITDKKTVNSGIWKGSAHTILLSRQNVFFPLSTLLAGTKETKKQPGFAKYDVDSQLIGEVTMDGLRCFKVRICIWTTGEARPPQDRGIDIWLAQDRNYLPIRMEFQSGRMGRGIPEFVGEVGELKQIASGAGAWLCT